MCYCCCVSLDNCFAWLETDGYLLVVHCNVITFYNFVCHIKKHTQQGQGKPHLTGVGETCRVRMGREEGGCSCAS